MNRIYFSTPGFYRIEVQGDVPANWSGRLGNMKIFSPSLSEATSKVTFLQGKVSDQSELSGILNSLYELHFSLLSVKYLGKDLSSADDVIK